MNYKVLAEELCMDKRPFVLVVGDVMLDSYWKGTVSRISPEAPVPVLALNTKNLVLGGAANVALNCKMLGMTVSLAGILGADDNATQLINILKSYAIESPAFVSDSARPTTLKTRIVAAGQQIVRIDEECTKPIASEIENEITEKIEAEISKKPDVIIVSDYGKGLITPNLCQTIIRKAKVLKIPVLIDPKGSNFSKYRGATIVSPNKFELSIASNTTGQNIQELIEAGQKMCKNLGIENIVLTRSEEGISLINRSQHIHFPATAREVVDVCGAGDSVISALALGLSLGLAPYQATQLGNTAGGMVVQKFGTASITRAELIREIANAGDRVERPKIDGLNDAQLKINQWKAAGERIVFTNGCFDVFHIGHLKLIEQCRGFGSKLVVGVNSDSSIKRLKGPSRPIMPEEQRSRILASLDSVDCVIIFEEDTPLSLIELIRPDVIVKGGDYTEASVIGAEYVKNHGGDIKIVPLVAGISTTAILQKIKELH